MNDKDAPLKASIEGRELVIRIGINTLAWVFDHDEANNPYDDEKEDYIQEWKVINPREFAEDVVRAIQREEEDGSSPLTNFIEQGCRNAADDGSVGIEEVEEEKK